VLVAHHLPILGAHLATTLARLHVQNIARRKALGGEQAGEKRRGSGDT
jgi:hypothetical protein